MQCPYCDSKTHVTNSRSHNKGISVWRRRSCSSCHALWTTTEIIDLSTTHRVRTAEKHLEPFSRDKLFVSIKDSCAHRKTALEDATALTNTILGKVLALKTPEITAEQIASITKTVVERFDPTAGAVYAAKHLSSL